MGETDDREARNSVVAVPDHVQWTEDDTGHVIVMNVDTGDLYGLAASGSLTWKVLAVSGSIAAAGDRLVETYGIELHVAVEDIRVLVDDLCAKNLLRLTEDVRG